MTTENTTNPNPQTPEGATPVSSPHPVDGHLRLQIALTGIQEASVAYCQADADFRRATKTREKALLALVLATAPFVKPASTEPVAEPTPANPIAGPAPTEPVVEPAQKPKRIRSSPNRVGRQEGILRTLATASGSLTCGEIAKSITDKYANVYQTLCAMLKSLSVERNAENRWSLTEQGRGEAAKLRAGQPEQGA